ncbi:MAG: hypothetical protein D6805_02450, partial [Planctomycetota bacterium]
MACRCKLNPELEASPPCRWGGEERASGVLASCRCRRADTMALKAGWAGAGTVGANVPPCRAIAMTWRYNCAENGARPVAKALRGESAVKDSESSLANC